MKPIVKNTLNYNYVCFKLRKQKLYLIVAMIVCMAVSSTLLQYSFKYIYYIGTSTSYMKIQNIYDTFLFFY